MLILNKQTEQKSLAKIIEIANKMLKGEINLAKGSREIVSLKNKIEDSENNIFNTFIMVDSDTDHIPLDQHVRKIWNKNALKELDKELDEYIQDMKLSIITGCKNLIKYYGKKK